ncbi:hypothetical protein HPB48_011944 [Haemaphysalis longicornis]|uniref:Uncharacterized protein n=1 Tax=Haemaphysalis longicornis TaxID=44386 RepID=A0A9J6GV66_HAELO|nr:hypothetical protein HPB48_011944 [Haemaphysalis longicornis]
MSILEKQFRAATSVSKVTGLSFITMSTNKGNLRFSIRFKTLGTAYGILLNGACICFESSVLLFKFFREIYEEQFGSTIFDIMLMTMFLKVAGGIGTYVFTARKLVCILNDMAAFERHIHFSRERTHGPCLSSRRLWILARSLSVGAFIASRYVTHEEFAAGQPAIIARAVSSIWSSVSVFVVYVASSAEHTLASMIYHVLGLYVDHLSSLVKLRTPSSSSVHKSANEWRVLQALRLKYLQLRRIVDSLNDILQYSALVSVTCSLVLLCLSAYFVVHPGASWTKLVFTICYFVLITLELTELVLSAANLKNKVKFFFGSF